MTETKKKAIAEQDITSVNGGREIRIETDTENRPDMINIPRVTNSEPVEDCNEWTSYGKDVPGGNKIFKIK